MPNNELTGLTPASNDPMFESRRYCATPLLDQWSPEAESLASLALKFRSSSRTKTLTELPTKGSLPLAHPKNTPK